jgi:hypothetical protein
MKWAAWSKENVPEQYTPFAAVACEIIRLQGFTPTPQAVRDRLVATGRDRESIIERHKKYGSSKRTTEQDKQVGQVEKVATRG